MSKENYNLLAKHYDSINPKEEIFKQKSFFKRLVDQYSIEKCLDCACGTGWHLHMLSELGLTCYGSDISVEMLSLARQNLDGKPIPLMLEDFRTLSYSWQEKFDMIICMTTSLPHMLTEVDTVAALQSIYERLNPNGILVISNGISDNLLDTKPKLIPARIHPDQAFYFFLEYPEPQRVVFNILLVQKTEESFEHFFDTMEYNAMRLSTLESYFAKTQFNKVEYFGGFDFSVYSTRDSSRLVAIAQK